MQLHKDGHAIQTVAEWHRVAPPKKEQAHWVEGRSALECARAWCGVEGGARVPTEIADLLVSHEHTRGYRIESATPEHRVRFDELPGEPRNADLAAVARNDDDALLAISVEAKADEPFGETVRDVLADVVDRVAHGERSNVVVRVQQLASALLPSFKRGLPRLGTLRYQLLTAAAGALAYAREVGARGAVLVVHEFVTDATDDRRHALNAADLDAFIQRLSSGAEQHVVVGRLLGPFAVSGAPLFEAATPLYLGKAQRVLRASAGVSSENHG